MSNSRVFHAATLLFFRLAAGIKYGLKKKISASSDNEEKTYFKLLKSAAVREALINVQPIVIPVNSQV